VARLGINSDIIENVELAVFDKDGTLMDLYKYWSSMVAFRVDLAQKRLGFDDRDRKGIMYTMGVDLDNQRLLSGGPVGLKKREVVMQAMKDALGIIGFTDTHDLCNECFNEADKLSIDHLSEIIEPVKSLHELINGLDRRKCRVAVATTDKSDRAMLAMTYMGIMDRVEVVIGADMVERSKPAPDMIEMILSKTGIKRENTVMMQWSDIKR
jgi:phosphoglycolate phosphatase